VYQDVQSAEQSNGKIDNTLARSGILQILMVGGRRPARCRDLRNEGFADRRIEAAAVLGNARVVDDHRAAARGKQPGVRGAQATTSASNDHDLAVETDRLAISMSRHRRIP
jgi:hypothetical protein